MELDELGAVLVEYIFGMAMFGLGVGIILLTIFKISFKRDARFTTGYKNNITPKWGLLKAGVTLIVLGLAVFIIILFSSVTPGKTM